MRPDFTMPHLCACGCGQPVKPGNRFVYNHHQGRPVADRLASMTNKDGPIPDHVPMLGPCWTFTGHLTKGGYGMICVREPRQMDKPAHRVAYELKYGSIPEGFDVCHKCDNPSCVRPDHLFASTVRGNLLDSVAKGRYNRPHGTASTKTTLTDEQVQEIRRRYVFHSYGPNGAGSLAREYGVCTSTIWNIVNRKTWKYA